MASHSSKKASKASLIDFSASSIVSPKLEIFNSGQRATNKFSSGASHFGENTI
jgi:hypothetical protein